MGSFLLSILSKSATVRKRTDWGIPMLALVTNVTTTFSNGTATLLVVLFLLGLYALINLATSARLVAIVVIIGVFFVHVPFVREVGNTIRQWLSDLLVNRGAPALVGDQAFSLLMVIAILVGYSLHVKNQKKDNDDQHKRWMIFVVVATIMLFTVGWAHDLVNEIGVRSAQFLDLLSRFPL